MIGRIHIRFSSQVFRVWGVGVEPSVAMTK
jgi:hypothetical protein